MCFGFQLLSCSTVPLMVGMLWVSAALKQYHALNGVLPDRIIVFRDGVGDGQLATVHEHEVKQLTDSFASIGSDYQ